MYFVKSSYLCNVINRKQIFNRNIMTTSVTITRTVERLTAQEADQLVEAIKNKLEEQSTKLQAEKDSLISNALVCLQGEMNIDTVRMYKRKVVVDYLSDLVEQIEDDNFDFPIDLWRHNQVEILKSKIYNWTPSSRRDSHGLQNEYNLHAWRRIVNVLENTGDIDANAYEPVLLDENGDVINVSAQ